MKACVFLATVAACVMSASSFAFTPPTRSTSSLHYTTVSRLTGAVSTRPVRARGGVGGISMKRKGKMNQGMAGQQRGNTSRMQQMQQRQAQEERKAMETGMPAFQIFVRTKQTNSWFPCGLMMGDDKAKATVDAMMGGILSGVSKYSLEKGIASSVLAKKRDLIQQVNMAFPQLKGRELLFGFKIIYRDLEDKMGKQEVTEITKDMTLGPLDTMKKKMGWG